MTYMLLLNCALKLVEEIIQLHFVTNGTCVALLLTRFSWVNRQIDNTDACNVDTYKVVNTSLDVT